MAGEHVPGPYICTDALDLSAVEAANPLFISAPAGFGKTALARHIVERHRGDTYECQLFGRQDGIRLLHRLVRCFVLDGVRVTTQSYEQVLLECIDALEIVLEGSEAPLVVFDGLEGLSAEHQADFLHLFDVIASKCKLILCSRTRIPQLHEWLLANGGVTLTERDLLFTASDIQRLPDLVGAENPEALPAEKRAVFHWPFAYAMASHSSVADKSELLEKIYETFSLCFLSWLSGDARMVLYAACFTEQFDVEYLVKVTDNPESPALLKLLINEGYLNKPTPETFELKPYIKVGVRHEFQYLAWNTRKSLKKRAAIYWADKQRYERALSFCERFQLWDASVAVLHRVAETFINAGRFEEMHKWFEALPPDYIDHDPLLMVYRVWCFPEYQKINGAGVYLRQVDAMLSSRRDETGDKNWLKANVHLSALRGYICRISGDYQGAVEHAKSAVAFANEGYPAILSRLYTTIGQDLYLKGDVVAAIASLKQAMVLGKQYKKHHDVLIAVGYTVAAMEFHGRFSQAIELFNEAMVWFEESGFMKTGAAQILNDPLTDVYRETFQFEQANQLAERMLRFCDQTTPALHHLTTFIRRYRLAINQNDPKQAYYALTQAEAFRDILGVSWAFGWAPVPAMRAEYELRFGDMRKADSYFVTREPALLGNTGFPTECERFIYALWLEKSERVKESREQLLLIQDQASNDQRCYHVIKANVQLALLLFDTDPARAILHLRDAICVVPEGQQIIGPFLWYGKKIIPLLNQVGAQLYQNLDGLRLLKNIRQSADMLWPQNNALNALDVLSERQITILKLLVNGDQDKVIAKKLNISPGTVKTHLRAIYRKLSCNNRSQAVSIAMEAGVMLRDDIAKQDVTV